MRGRYVGTVPTTFEAPVGVVRHGDEFTLPPGREKSFLQHGRIEPADKAAKDFVAKLNKPADTVPSVVIVPDPQPASSDK